MNRPNILKLELTSRCNGRCVFCGHEGGGRAVPDMPLELALKVIDELADDIEEVQPQFYGEPTLYPHFNEVVEHCRSKGLRVAFYTNGSGRLEFDDIWPTSVIFSIDYHTEELCKKIRPGLNFERVLGNVLEFWTDPKRIEARCTCVIRATRCKENERYEKEMREFWGAHTDNFVIYDEMPRCRGESVGTPEKNYKCKRIDEHLVVLSDGTVVLCCIDWKGEHPGGNINEMSAIDAWNTEGLEAVRRAIRDKDWPAICGDCGFRYRGK